MTADQAEAFFNLANNGVLTRIDERGQRAGELFQWGWSRLNDDRQAELEELVDVPITTVLAAGTPLG